MKTFVIFNDNMRYIKYLLFIFLSFVFSFCNESEIADELIKQNKTIVVNTDSGAVVLAKDPAIPVAIMQSNLPLNVSFKGNSFYSAYQWEDKTGRNILVLSTSSLSANNKEIGETENTGELFARLININDPQKPIVVWDMYDAQKKCIFDLTCDFVTSEITDLDKDSVKEIFIMYKLSCRSDVSPANIKLILHEGKQKYALRGKMIFIIRDIPDTLFPETREVDLSKISKEELETTMFRDWGCYDNANDFKTAPPVFLEYAKELWVNNCKE